MLNSPEGLRVARRRYLNGSRGDVRKANPKNGTLGAEWTTEPDGKKNQKWGEKAALTADQVCALLRENYIPWQGYMSCDVFLPG